MDGRTIASNDGSRGPRRRARSSARVCPADLRRVGRARARGRRGHGEDDALACRPRRRGARRRARAPGTAGGERDDALLCGHRRPARARAGRRAGGSSGGAAASAFARACARRGGRRAARPASASSRPHDGVAHPRRGQTRARRHRRLAVARLRILGRSRLRRQAVSLRARRIAAVRRSGLESVLLDELLRSPAGERFTRVGVGALDVQALGRVVHEQLGATLPRPLLAEIHGAAGGNPFYALEIVRALQRTALRSRPATRSRCPSRCTSSSRAACSRCPRTAASSSLRQRHTPIPRSRSPRRHPESSAPPASRRHSRRTSSSLTGTGSASPIRCSPQVRTNPATPFAATRSTCGSPSFSMIPKLVRGSWRRRRRARTRRRRDPRRRRAPRPRARCDATRRASARARGRAHARGLRAGHRRDEESPRLTLITPRGDTERARLLLEPALRSAPGPERAGLLVALARIRSYDDDLRGASELFRQAIVEAPTGSRSRRMRKKGSVARSSACASGWTRRYAPREPLPHSQSGSASCSSRPRDSRRRRLPRPRLVGSKLPRRPRRRFFCSAAAQSPAFCASRCSRLGGSFLARRSHRARTTRTRRWPRRRETSATRAHCPTST